MSELTFTADSTSARGVMLVEVGNGMFEYEVPPTEGQDSFGYTITDPFGAFSTGIVTIPIDPFTSGE